MIKFERRPPHPGRAIGKRIDELGITRREASRKLKIPESRLSHIVNGDHNISPDLAYLFYKTLGVNPQKLLYMQSDYVFWEKLPALEQKYTLVGLI